VKRREEKRICFVILSFGVKRRGICVDEEKK